MSKSKSKRSSGNLAELFQNWLALRQSERGTDEEIDGIADEETAIDRAGIEKAMGEAWIARFLRWSKRSAFIKTTARTGSLKLAA